MNQAYTALEVPVSRNILVIPAGCAIVRKTESMPIAKVGIQKPLIRTVETDPSLGERQQSIVIAHVRLQV